MRVAGSSRGFPCVLLGTIFLPTACSSTPSESIGVDHSADTAEQGYCRSRTCPPTSDYPKGGACEPPGWAGSPACAGQASDAPVWWHTACVGYDLNESASRYVPYDTASQSVRAAFDAWLQANCSPSAGGGVRPSIDVRDLGPVPCAHAAYDKTGGPNQNVIVFHDDAWPHDVANAAGLVTKSLTVALTTVTSNAETGEIYDADIELNSADYVIAQLPAGTPGDGMSFDLQSVLTHEIGHFLGLAHSPLADAVMYASGDGDRSTTRRVLAAEDVRGICAIYPPDGTRSVSALVDASGQIAEGTCDPTPHHGFTASCP
jgi:hypothetical protein